MDLKFAKYILALDETRNVTRAAKQLGMSQGALSNFLKKHEEDMAMQIFIRYRNVLIPTQVGRLYINALRQMVSIKEYTYQRIRTQCGNVESAIRIGVTPSRGLRNLTGAYSEYVKWYPKVKLDIREEYVTGLMDLMEKKELDMFFGAMVQEELASSVWSCYKLRPIRMMAAVHRFLVDGIEVLGMRERFPVIQCSQLQKLPVILHGERTSIGKVQNTLFMNERFSPVVIAEGNNTKMVQQLIKGGLGVGFLPEDYMNDVGMEEVEGFYIEPTVYIYRCIALPKGSILTDAQRCLADLIWENELAGYGMSLN